MDTRPLPCQVRLGLGRTWKLKRGGGCIVHCRIASCWSASQLGERNRSRAGNIRWRPQRRNLVIGYRGLGATSRHQVEYLVFLSVKQFVIWTNKSLFLVQSNFSGLVQDFAWHCSGGSNSVTQAQRLVMPANGTIRAAQPGPPVSVPTAGTAGCPENRGRGFTGAVLLRIDQRRLNEVVNFNYYIQGAEM